MTNRVGFNLSTVVADSLQQLLDLGEKTYACQYDLGPATGVNQHTNVVNRSCELDVAKVSRTFLLALLTSLAIPLSIDGSQARVIQTFCPRSRPLLILQSSASIHPYKQTKNPYHRLWVFHMAHTQAFDFLGGEETELDLLDGAQRRLGVREVNVGHDDRRVTLLEREGSWGVRKRVIEVARWGSKQCWTCSWPAAAVGSPCHQGAGGT